MVVNLGVVVSSSCGEEARWRWMELDIEIRDNFLSAETLLSSVSRQQHLRLTSMEGTSFHEDITFVWLLSNLTAPAGEVDTFL